ncbi:MAG: hypothetical protein AABM41_03890 [Chloroflexota bacterium]
MTGLVTACTAAPSASPSAAEPSATTAAVSGLPPGCETIDLRSPTGERIDLTGEWAGTGILAGESESAWLQQIGDCVYGSVVGTFVRDAEVEASLTNLSGHLGSDFRIGFETVIVSQPQIFALGTYSTMVMRIEWDADGRIRLREDREPGEAAGRCIQGYCPNPVIWYRVDEAPPS